MICLKNGIPAHMAVITNKKQTAFCLGVHKCIAKHHGEEDVCFTLTMSMNSGGAKSVFKNTVPY